MNEVDGMPMEEAVMSFRNLVVFVALVTGGACVGACGDTSEAAPPTSATATTTAVTTAAPQPMHEVTRDLVYHQGDERFQRAEGRIDVIAPVGAGPWPVVVAFHGDPRFVGRSWMLREAEPIADEGRVVFVPDWGHIDSTWEREVSLETQFDLLVEEVLCAVVFARDRAAEFGGDPDHITVYGYSAGGNAALMAGFSDATPLRTCAADGAAVVPRAVVSGDGDLLMGAADWDRRLEEEPDAFYALTPWRLTDGSHDFRITIVSVDTMISYTERKLDDDPSASPMASRHADIDLIASVEAMGLIGDGILSSRDANEWAHETLRDLGYDVHWVLLPDSTHESLSAEGRATLVDTVVHAEG